MDCHRVLIPIGRLASLAGALLYYRAVNDARATTGFESKLATTKGILV